MQFARENSDDYQNICLLWPQILVLPLPDLETPTADYICLQMVPLRSIFLLCVSYKIGLNIGQVYTSFLIYANWLLDWEINLRTIKHVRCTSRKYRVQHDGLSKQLSKTLRDESQLGAYVMMQIAVDAFSPSERVSRLPSTRSVHQNASTRPVIFGSNAMIIPLN